MNTYSYDFINRYNAHIKPSTVHTQENATTWYFRRYLLQKILSVYEFKGIPETWSKDYFLYTLFLWGFVAVIKTDKFGVIPQHCSLFGYDVFYRPTNVNIANPLLRGNLTPKIGTECELIKLQPDYGSCWDIISYYADLLSLSTESLGVNLVNSKLCRLFKSIKDKSITLFVDSSNHKNNETIEDMTCLEYADYFLCNEFEATQLCETDDIYECERKLYSAGIKDVIIKCGEKGCFYKGKYYKTRKIECIDSTGAGDSFAAGFIKEISENKTVEEAIETANKCGSRACEYVGTTEWLQHI